MPRAQRIIEESESSDSDFIIASSEDESISPSDSDTSVSAVSTLDLDSEASESFEHSDSGEADTSAEAQSGPARSCTNPTCLQEIEKLQEEANGYFLHFRKYAQLTEMKEYIKLVF